MTAARANELMRCAWHGGQLLAFSGLDGPTDYAQGLTLRTAFDAPGLDVKWPAAGRLRFPHSDAARFAVTGDWFIRETPPGTQRGAFLDAHHFLIEGPCEAGPFEPGLSCHRAGGRTLVGATAFFRPERIADDLDAALGARARWLDRAAVPTGFSPVRRRTFLKALSIMKGQVYTPEGVIAHRWTTPDRWPHRHMWLWDSAFHAIGWRHVDPALARDMLAAVLDTQREDGFVAHMLTPSSRSAITQPPVLALAAQLVDALQPADAWVAALYPKLAAYVRWDLANRDRDGAGLVEWAIEGNPLCRSGESGMDNSPRFDSAASLDAVDFNAYLASECEILAAFARRLGLQAESAGWAAAHRQLCDRIATRLWSERHGFFVDYDVERQAQSDVLASSGFLPLLCGAATPAQAARLLAHLEDPQSFGTPFPVPSIAARDAAHYAKDMWRGPVWINVNWLIARGLDRYGFAPQARRLREQTRRELEAQHEAFGTLFEFYDDRREVPPPALCRKGQCAPEVSPYHQVFHDYGWTATLYVDMVAQDNPWEIRP